MKLSAGLITAAVLLHVIESEYLGGEIAHRSLSIVVDGTATDYDIAVVGLAFDGAVYINGSYPLPLQYRRRYSRLDQMPSLNGTFHMVCNDVFVDSASSHHNHQEEGDYRDHVDDIKGSLPLHLVPINVAYDVPPSISTVMQALSFPASIPSNYIVAIVLMESRSKYGHFINVPIESIQGKDCRLLIVSPHLRTNDNWSEVTNTEGSTIYGDYPLENVSDFRDSMVFKIQGDTLAPPDVYSSIKASDRFGKTGKVSKKLRKMLKSHSEFVDEEASIPTDSIISLVEVVGGISSMETLRAGQYFELIEDPLMNMLVPMVVQIVMSIIRTPILEAIVGMMAPIIGMGVAIPITRQMKMIEVDEVIATVKERVSKLDTAAVMESLRNNTATVGGSTTPKGTTTGEGSSSKAKTRPEKLVEELVTGNLKIPKSITDTIMFKGLEKTNATLAASIKSRLKAKHEELHDVESLSEDQVAMMMKEARAKIESTSEIIAALEAPLAMNDEDIGGSLGPCEKQLTFASCMAASAKAESENKMDLKCSWCMKKDAYGVVARCEACNEVKLSEAEGLSCFPVANVCSKKIEEAKKEIAKDPKKFEFKYRKPSNRPSDIETSISNIVAGDILPKVSAGLHAALTEKLRPDLTRSVVREASRTISHLLTTEISSSLPQLIADASTKGIVAASTKRISEVVTQGVTHAASQTISAAMTRNPESDYFCYYCSVHNEYCDRCQVSKNVDSVDAHYVNHFANYYGDYFSWYYSGVYSDYAAADFFSLKHNETVTVFEVSPRDVEEVERTRGKPTVTTSSG